VKTVQAALNNSGVQPGSEGHRDLIEALAGRQGDRDGAVAYRTRRVVMASLGVLQEQKAGRRRARCVALAGILVALLLLGPIAWRITDDLVGGEFFSDLTTQFSLWYMFLCVAFVGAVLVAGWVRHKS
jgi:hypothetical protein